MLAVTTFPEWGWDVYAKKCINTWIKAWPGSILAYYEGAAPPSSVPGVEFRPLDSKARTRFLQLQVPTAKTFLHDVKRFCHKVFAQILTMEENDQFYWLDADIEMIESPPEDLIREIIEQSFVAFLGRNTYTEAGVIAFNKLDEQWKSFERRYRWCYEENGIFRLPYWTDCHAFDYARNGGGYNMTPDGQGVNNVLPDSPLGPYMVHHKGALKLKLEEQ